MVFYTLVLQFYLKECGNQKKEEDDTFLRKKSSRKTKQFYDNDICRWKRGRFSCEVKIIRGIVCIKILKREIFKKDSMNLIETNYQTNMTCDHSVSSNNSFKSHLNAKSFNMLF